MCQPAGVGKTCLLLLIYCTKEFGKYTCNPHSSHVDAVEELNFIYGLNNLEKLLYHLLKVYECGFV